MDAGGATEFTDYLRTLLRRSDTSSSKRNVILGLVRGHPGMRVTDICRATGLTYGAVDHHLRRLAERGQVHWVTALRRRMVFPGARPLPLEDGAPLLATLQRATMLAVARAICARPGRSPDDIALAAPASHRAVYHHLKTLRGLGLIRTQPRNRYRRVFPARQLEQLVHLLEAMPAPLTTAARPGCTARAR